LKTSWLHFTVFFVFLTHLAFSQLIPGRIVQHASTTVMNPNGDNWVTKNGTQFTPGKGYWVDEFELPMFGIPKLTGDAIKDNIGQPCGITDLIPDNQGYSVYALRDANNNLIFRFRVGNNNPSVEAWTILLDVDGLFGSADPNATGINPGFEIDITLIKRQNAGVFVYNIDGITNCPQPLLNFPIVSNFQIAVADEVTCGDLDYFYDFYVNFTQVAAAYNAASNSNIDANTGLRYAAVTNVSATCAVDGNIADVSGVDDNDYQNNIAGAFVALIEAQCPTAVNDLCSTCLGFNSGLPAKPTITEPIRAGQTFVSGTSQQGTYIKLSIYSIVPGTESNPQWQTTPREEHVVFVSASGWTITLNGPLQAYDRIVAKAQLNADGSGCGSASGNEASTSVTVVEPNVAPVANDQLVDVFEDTPKAIQLEATDADGDVLAYSIVASPTNGTLSCTNCSNPTYTPNANYFGPDSFTFRAYDGVLYSNVATVTINVIAVNDAPVANNQNLTTPEDTPLSITLTASDIENNPLTYIVVAGPTNGTLSGTAPNLTYTPNANYFGPDSFTFYANDGSLDSNIATISINVTAVNDAPVASDLSVTTPEDTPVLITMVGTDVDNTSLTYTIISSPTNGTLTGSGASRTYTPAANYNGSDSFTYRVSDGQLQSNIATVSITVTPVNDAPVANSQNLTTPEDTPLPITLTGSDVDGDAITFSVVTQPQNGVLTGSGANLTYTPNANFNGQDNFTFVANDGAANSATATIFITVTPVPDVPVANNLSVTTNEDTPVSFTLTGSDPDGDNITFIVLTNPANGTLSGTAPNLTYTPSANFNGSDSFTFKVNDGTSDSAPATVSITVNPVNDAPVAQAQSVNVPEDTPTVITMVATDVDGNPLTYIIVTPPQNGSLSVVSGNQVTYTPNANYNGPDSFVFKANDGSVDSNNATVSITVTPVNDAPVANAQSITVNEDTSIGITLTGSDVDGNTLTFSVVTGPANGTLSCTNCANPTYTPNLNYNGPDSFTFKVNDGTVDSAPATVSITVTPVNDAPIANSQTVTVPEDTPTAITLTGSDVDGDALTFTVLTNPTNGTLSGTAPNLTYTPNANYTGPDSFTFRVNDGSLNSAAATVSINVTPQNDAPVANAQSLTTPEDTPLPITLSGSDVDGDAMTFTVVTGPSNGTLSGTASNLTYTPNLNYNGPDSFTFKVNDGTVDSAPATISITVTPVNDTPVASNVSVSVPEDTPTTIQMNASDVDGDPLVYSIVSGPSNGTLGVINGNEVVYSPNNNYVGPDSFTYRVFDGTAFSNTATVNISVTPLNDAPVANNQSVTVTEDTAKDITLTASDADGDALTYSIVTSPSNGTLSVISGNIVTYTPNANYTGPDSFQFRVNDGTVFSNTATVSITVTPVNDPPVVFDATIVYDLNTPVNFTLQAFDADGDPLIYTILSLPANGVISGTAPNLTYTPALNDNGNYTLTFKVNDGTVDSGVATISINFNVAGNDPPVANNQSVTTNEDVSVNITLSASDPDGDPLTYIIVSGPSNGTLTATGNPAVYTYTPDANYNGPDNFTFKVNDLTVDSNTATVSITVNPVNDAPVANNQTVVYTVNGSTPITLTGSDVDGDPLTFTVLTQPSNGTLTGSGTSYTYTPNTNYNGLDSFTFKVNDGQVDSQPATVSLTASTANNAPIANAQSVTTPEDTPLVINLTGFDVDGNTLTFSVVSSPTNGTLSCNNCANPTYTPALNYNGPDSFTFKVNDGTVDSAPATVSITVTPVNDTPIANGQTVSVPEDTPTAITLTGSDVDGDALTFTVLTNPANGTLSGTAPNLTYTPNANYTGPDSFTFRVNDGSLNSAAATVSINVTPQNDAPVANAQSLTTPEDTQLLITLDGSDVDGDALSFTVLTGPANGTLSGTAPNLTYTPNLNYNGPDSFTFKVNDGTVDSTPATVSITVTPVNDAPVANSQTVTVQEDTPKAITLTGSDVDGDPITSFTVLTNPANGTLSGTAPNLTYTPNADYTGPDSFTFRVSDGSLNSAAATVSINVMPENDAPVASPQTLTTPEDTQLPITLTGSDIDGDALTYSIVVAPTNGTLSCNNCANPTYTPALNYNGPDSFTFKVNDGTVDSNVATVSITVTPVNDAPIANNQTVTVQEDVAKDITLTGSDVDGDALTFTILTQPAQGVLSGSGANVVYTPGANYSGSDSFTFKVNDGTVDSNVATVTINVVPVNDAPVAVDDIITTPEDVAVTFNISSNDTDIDGTINPATVDLDPSTPAEDKTFTVTGEGVYTVDVLGNVTYTPTLDYNGTNTSVSYTVKDNNGALSNTAFIQVTVTPVNDPPVVTAATVTINEDEATSICFTFTDVENDPAVFTGGASLDGNGSLVLDPATGQFCFLYTPKVDYFGSDRVEVTICDANDNTICSTGIITININPVNDTPRIIVNNSPVDVISLTTPEDTPLPFCFDADDIESDNLSVGTITNLSGGGTLVPGTGGLNQFCFTFTPATNFTGVSSWKIQICDDGNPSQCKEVTININITPVNDAPVAEDQTVTTPEDTPTAITLLGTDTDGDPLTYMIVSNPTKGVLSGSGATRTYTPNLNYNGTDSFTFKVNDGKVDSNTATVTINVTPANDAPFINPIPILYTPEDTPLQICIGAEDVEGHTLTYNSPTNISGGGTMTVTPGLTFCFDFMPVKDFNGESSWTFRVCDNGTPSMCSEVIVRIVVTPVNDAPVAVNDFITAQSFVRTEPVNILANDRDVENNPLVLTTTQLAGPYFGTVTMNANGLFTYKSILGYIGPDSLRYEVCDTGTPSLCDVGVVFIEVGPAPFKIYEGLSPNGDGLNDYWRIDGIEVYPNNRVKIFDRYNNLVFETTGYNNEGNSWRGQVNHGLMSGSVTEGTYYYALDLGDGSEILSGFIVLKKE
jgi:gliding motility-associated-like protein